MSSGLGLRALFSRHKIAFQDISKTVLWWDPALYAAIPLCYMLDWALMAWLTFLVLVL